MDALKTLSFEFLLVSGVGFVIWLIRLEGKVKHLDDRSNSTQKDVDVVRSLQAVHEGKIADQLAKVRESLARIEGFLKIKDE
jgi:hypothetical protein